MKASAKKTNYQRKTNLILGQASNGRVGLRNFKAVFPKITQQIKCDALSSCFSFWGNSYNIDEFEGSVIVDPKLLTAIGKIAGFPIRSGKHYHAGLIHTYGYLLSNLKTRFGYKRERWTKGSIESVFRIPDGTLIGRRDESTLLQNVTYLIGKIAFDTTSQCKAIESLPNVSTSLLDLRFEKMCVTRIEETVKIGRRPQQIKLFTDFVDCGVRSPMGPLLVYSFRHLGFQRLVTCFPITRKHRDELLDATKENSTPIRPRFNLAIAGFENPGVVGKRKIILRRRLKI